MGTPRPGVGTLTFTSMALTLSSGTQVPVPVYGYPLSPGRILEKKHVKGGLATDVCRKALSYSHPYLNLKNWIVNPLEKKARKYLSRIWLLLLA